MIHRNIVRINYMLRTYKAQEGEWNYNIESEFYHLYDDGFFLPL